MTDPDMASTHASTEGGSIDIDGVPVFWGDTPGPLQATLVFRVGQADETLRRRGLTHLIHHLALANIGQTHSASTGHVGQLFTTFVVSGTEEEVVSTLNDLTRGLATLPSEQIPAQIAAIGAEPRPSGWATELLTLRFGLRGYGLVACDELGLLDADAEDVDNWQHAWFTAENAALVCSRRPPEGIDLSRLPSGIRKPAPLPHPNELQLPAVYHVGSDVIALSLLVDDGAVTDLAGELLLSRLNDRILAIDETMGPIETDELQVGDGKEVLSLAVRVSAERAVEVRDALSSELFKFSMSGPEPESLDSTRLANRRGRGSSAPDALAMAQQAAMHFLLDDDGDLGPAIDDITPVDIAAIIRAATPSAIWLVPPDVEVHDRRLFEISAGSSSMVTGNEFRTVPTLVPDRLGDRLIVGVDGITLLYGGTLPVTVQFLECVTLQVWADGARTLWGADGIRFLIHPSTWLGGDDVIAWIDSQIDTWLRLDMATPSGYILPLAVVPPAPGR